MENKVYLLYIKVQDWATSLRQEHINNFLLCICHNLSLWWMIVYFLPNHCVSIRVISCHETSYMVISTVSGMKFKPTNVTQ